MSLDTIELFRTMVEEHSKEKTASSTELDRLAVIESSHRGREEKKKKKKKKNVSRTFGEIKRSCNRVEEH